MVGYDSTLGLGFLFFMRFTHFHPFVVQWFPVNWWLRGDCFVHTILTFNELVRQSTLLWGCLLLFLLLLCYSTLCDIIFKRDLYLLNYLNVFFLIVIDIEIFFWFSSNHFLCFFLPHGFDLAELFLKVDVQLVQYHSSPHRRLPELCLQLAHLLQLLLRLPYYLVLRVFYAKRLLLLLEVFHGFIAHLPNSWYP